MKNIKSSVLTGMELKILNEKDSHYPNLDLLCFYLSDETHHIRGISRILKIPTRSISRYAENLESAGLVKPVRKKGKRKLCIINTENTDAFILRSLIFFAMKAGFMLDEFKEVFDLPGIMKRAKDLASDEYIQELVLTPIKEYLVGYGNALGTGKKIKLESPDILLQDYSYWLSFMADILRLFMDISFIKEENFEGIRNFFDFSEMIRKSANKEIYRIWEEKEDFLDLTKNVFNLVGLERSEYGKR